MKIINTLFIILIVISLISWYLGSPPSRFSEPKSSDHYSLGAFSNPWYKGPVPSASFSSLMKWRQESKREPWPEAPADFVIKQKPPLDKKNFVQFINHATVLFDLEGNRFITDPIFSERASPISYIGPKRHHPTPMKIDELGRLDFVLVSHNHYDHMDLESLKQLNDIYQPTFVVPHSNGPYLVEAGIPKEKIIELDLWESTKTKNLTITLAPAQHWSKRRFFDRDFALWGSFVVENGSKKVFFAGDTGFGEHLQMIHQRWPNFDISLIPVGSYEPRWFMSPQHVNPEEAARAHLILESKKSIGIHHSCFQLTDEDWGDPLIALIEAKVKYHIDKDAFLYPRAGEIFEF